MYVTIRKYTGCGDVGEIDRISQAELLPLLRKVKGFRSYVTIDTGGHTVTSISTFGSKEAAEEANRRARETVQKSLAKLLPNPPEVMVGEILTEAN